MCWFHSVWQLHENILILMLIKAIRELMLSHQLSSSQKAIVSRVATFNFVCLNKSFTGGNQVIGGRKYQNKNH